MQRERRTCVVSQIVIFNLKLRVFEQSFNVWISDVDGFFRNASTTWCKVLRESATPRESLPNGAAYMEPFRHLGTSRSPIVGTINHHHACDA